MKRVLVGAAIVTAGLLGSAPAPASACDASEPTCVGPVIAETLITINRTVVQPVENAVWGPLNDHGIYCAGPYPFC